MAPRLNRVREVTALADIVRGTLGPDTIAVAADGQTVAGQRGNDRLSTAFTDTSLFGGAGDDRMLSTYSLGAATPAWAATLDGGVGDDRLTVRLDAAESSPSAYAGSASLLASGSDGNDRINVTASFDSYAIYPELSFDFLLLGGAPARRRTPTASPTSSPMRRRRSSLPTTPSPESGHVRPPSP
ncbi:hypothetical protein [Amaricoccus sp.]|uniref:hypothetical protein n=1 Tax=Amaricoccus sp. TaxID=1872485 RepID=UPI001B67753C|nr:hypothetical protein [Amaricoccus sp.]MBP7000917.1 hypothetical protein [Amaricoccus sp.]